MGERYLIDVDAAAFEAHLTGAKSHELIREESVEVGYVVVLREIVGGAPTGRKIDRRVSYLTSAEFPCALSDAGLRPGHSILSLTDPE